MSWNSSWPTISKSLGKLSLLGLYLSREVCLRFMIREPLMLYNPQNLSAKLSWSPPVRALWRVLYVFLVKRSATDATGKLTFGKRTITEFSRNVMRKMTCLGTKRWSFTADHQIYGAKVEILFRSFHCKILGDKRKFWKGSPVFPIGTLWMEIRFPFTSFLSFVLVSCCN